MKVLIRSTSLLMSIHNICFHAEIRKYQYFGTEKKKAMLERAGPSCSKLCKLNELVSGQNVNCSSKYNIYFTGIYDAEKILVAFANALYIPYYMIKVLIIC